jgi:zinc transport system substrate-binding protein
MATVAVRTGEAFAAAHPAGAEGYLAGAARVAAELRALDAELSTLLSGCRHDRVVVSHEAYAYLLAPHGLEQVGVSPPGAHGEASPRDITELAAAVRDAGIDLVLSEPVEGRAGAAAVAREAGVGLADIYSLDIVSPREAAAGYPELLRRQAAAVARAAECAGG